MPTRNLSIMFTDIKGFTHRTSSSTRDAMTKMMDKHARLLLPVFRYFDGTVVKTIGDAYLVYFSSPTDAVLCGVTIQEVLRQHNKDLAEEERLEIRVAINVGDVELMDNDVMGEPVNIAARLEGVAEAGQVYFTEAVYQTMNRREAPSAEVGEHVFKGIPHPIRIYKVIDEPDSELARRLSESVSLSANGPVIAGIREEVAQQPPQKKIRPKYVYAGTGLLILVVSLLFLLPSERDKHLRAAQLLQAEANYTSALNIIEPDILKDPADKALRAMAVKLATSHINKLVQQGAIQAAYSWLDEALTKRHYLETLRPELAVLDARLVVKNDPTGNHYTAFYELADKYPENPRALYTAAKLLEEGTLYTYMTVWLYKKVLERGAYRDDVSIFEHSINVLKHVKHYNSQKTAHDIIEKYFTQRAVNWAKQALDEGTAAEVLHGYKVLQNLSDPIVKSDYYSALYKLVQGEELGNVFSRLKDIKDVGRQKHVLALEKELVETYPRFFMYSSARDEIARNRQQLMTMWALK